MWGFLAGSLEEDGADSLPVPAGLPETEQRLQDTAAAAANANVNAMQCGAMR